MVVNRVDTSSPTLTLLPNSEGNVDFNIDLNGTFTDPGATAQDLVDGDLTSQIQVTGTVDTSVAAVYQLNYSIVDSSNLGASATRSVTVKEPHLFFDGTTYTSPAGPFPSGLGTTLTSQPSLLEQGFGKGYRVSFDFFKGTDEVGVVLSILDSTVPSGTTYFEAPSQPMTASLVFKMVGAYGLIVYTPFSHPSWGSNRYFNPIMSEQDIWGSRVSIPSGWNTYTLTITDKDSSNYLMVWTNGSGTQTRDIPKGFPSGNTYRAYLGRTSTWDGFAILGIPVNGALLGESYAGGSHIATGGAQIRNISISAV